MTFLHFTSVTLLRGKLLQRDTKALSLARHCIVAIAKQVLPVLIIPGGVREIVLGEVIDVNNGLDAPTRAGDGDDDDMSGLL
jgi:hypothetical protein